MDEDDFDDVVIGAGLGGLSVAALLAKAGRRVLVLEAHDAPGGYAHTFRMGAYRFCAQVHYIFNCGEGEAVHELLDRLGLAAEVPFLRLDPEGFDHIIIGGERTRVPSGLQKYRARLLRRFPEHGAPLRAYFDTVERIGRELDELDAVPRRLSLSLLPAAYRLRHLLRYLRSTLEDFYDQVRMPPLLRAILAGQCGDYLLPPRDVSFLLHVALVYLYDRGAFYPRKHFFHMVDSIVGAIRAAAGSQVLLSHAVERIHVEGRRAVAITAQDGRRFTARRFISNVDPKLMARLVGPEHLDARDRRRLDYEYSCGTITLYLGLRGLDLRDHGFGSFNVWHYPHADLNRIYDDQLRRHDLSDPWLFMSTPTLHSDAPGLCPPGHQILEVATACDHGRLARLRSEDRRAYNKEKRRIRETILDVIEARYVPRLRDHLSLRVTGTPATNERFCGAPAGNAYGAALTPRNVTPWKGPYRTSLDNLYQVNATAGFPSVAGTISAGMRLYRELAA